MEQEHRDTASKDLGSSSWAEPEPCEPQKPPDILTAEDVTKISANDDIAANVRFLEAMNARYDNHPYFTAKLAMRMEDLGATAISASLLRQVFASLLHRPHLTIILDQGILRAPQHQRRSP